MFFNNKALNIVFNDEYLVVVNKLAKVAVQASKGEVTLSSILEKVLNEKVFPCHRLDKETSGLVVFAKSVNVRDSLMAQFKNREVYKKYVAFVRGRIEKEKDVLESFILDKPGKKFGEKNKKAITFYRLIKRYPRFSVVELVPKTGRTHQLRIHMADLGHPILGERTYAFRRDFPLDFKRLALHAYSLEFVHPVSKDKVCLKVDLPKDMQEFLKSFVDK